MDGAFEKRHVVKEEPPFTPGRVPVPSGMAEMYKDAPGNDLNVNVTFKREKREPVESAEGDHHKKMRYNISKHIDDNRDLYFVKLVAGALKRRHFQTLIEVEEEHERPPHPAMLPGSSIMNVYVKYSYSFELLHAWTTIIEKVKKMIDPSVTMSNPLWRNSEDIHKQIIENDTAVTAFARYVAFIMVSETNNFIPRNRTRYVLEMDQQQEGNRVLDVMRALHTEFNVLNRQIGEKYGIFS